MNVHLSVAESLTFAKNASYWDGFAAGATAAAAHAKDCALQDILAARPTAQPSPPPAPEPPAPEPPKE